MTTVVVTGASGFLGSAVVSQLRERGLRVMAVSRRPQPGVHQVDDYMDTPAADVIVHLAEEPDRAQVNRLGELYVDHAARVVEKLAACSQLLVYASSGVVYGDQSEWPFAPDMHVSASDAYSGSKIRNEQIVLQAKGTVARLSNLYGDGMSHNNVLSDIARQIPGDAPLQVRDDTPIRDFLGVADAARALVLMAARVGTPPLTKALNVGSGFGLSIRELAQLALEATGQHDRRIVSTQPTVPGRRSINVLDISETQRDLGWTPASPPRDQLTKFFQNGASLDD